MPYYRVQNICQIITETALLLVFLLVPLIIIPVTSEVFEFNKLTLVYTLATLILTSETIRILSSEKPTLKLPPFAITAGAFLLSLLLTTLTSIDPHVSLFGYYGRFHGGLISWIAYSFILLALIQQTPSFIRTTIKITLFSGIFVSSWGILEHLGIDASYWVQDVKFRVFSTIGQPNWLAAFLAMLLPFLFSFYLEAKNRKLATALLALSILFYTCFIFTYSRGGNLGLAAAVLTWVVLIGFKKIKANKLRLALFGTSLAIITILFASSLTSALFRATPHRTVENLQTGDQTAQTRLIVWQGSLDIFLHHPLLGTGLETFGESFYQYRPVAMNHISDFDFLFNKAHNEYLNYLATTGTIGTIAYLMLLINFFYLTIKKLKKEKSLIVVAASSSMVGYLVQNIFGFTVVPLAILFILNLAVVGVENQRLLIIPTLPKQLRRLISIPAIVIAAAFIFLIISIWRADLAYNQGLSAGNSLQSINDFTTATHLNPTEPLYYSELALSYAQAASLIPNTPTAHQDATLAKKYSDLAISISPDERTIWRIRAQVFSTLIPVDYTYKQQAFDAYQKTISLAPTDPRVRTELASYYISQHDQNQAISTLKKALELKSDFIDANISLAQIYFDQGNKLLAQKYLNTAKKTDPKNPTVWSLKEELRQ